MKYIPTYTIIVFVLLYVISASLYPGGHHLDHEYIGFSWKDNYWCDMFMPIAYNGVPNPARTWSIASTILVSFGFCYFFYIYPTYVKCGTITTKMIKFGGLGAALMALPIFTDWGHNYAIILASLSGCIALIGGMITMYQNDRNTQFVFGSVCIIVMSLTNYMYYMDWHKEHLPWIQKIAFGIVLCWLMIVNISYGKKLK